MTTLGDRDQPAMELELEKDRREFLASCGRFAAVTPPALTLLLSTSLKTEAIARSGGDMGWGGHDHDGGRHDHHRNDR